MILPARASGVLTSPLTALTLSISLILLSVLVMGASPAPVLAAQSDLLEDFTTNPATNSSWFLTSGWSWKASTHLLASAAPERICLARWTGRTFTTGTLSARIKLVPTPTTPAPSGGLVFAYQPDTGSHRYVTITGGSSGAVSLTQKGDIEGVPGGEIARNSRFIPLKTWLFLTVDILPEGGVNVYLSLLAGQRGDLILTASPLPYANGQIGIRSKYSQINVDDLRFSIVKPDLNKENCERCHNGNPPPAYVKAPNVMQYWDGSWWDTTQGGSDTIPQGGHGDPDHDTYHQNYTPSTCTGLTGCHDMNQSKNTHRDNILINIPTDRGNRTSNTFHLRSEYINLSPSHDEDVQVTFDNFCYNACHKGLRISDCRHESDHLPSSGAVELGTHLTWPFDPFAFPLPVDSDLTTATPNFSRGFAPCISCHDPHGSGMTQVGGATATRSNHMLRYEFNAGNSALCLKCHR